MKRLVLLLAMLFAVVPFGFSRGNGPGPGHHHSSHVNNHASKKSHTSGSHDGTYEGGRGSSHKDGHYKNQKTHNHYRDRKHGTPQ
jgi:hypothetical protein